MRILFVALLTTLSQITLAATPVPYEWGVYKAPAGKSKIIIENWYTAEGRKRLARSRYNQDFYQLAHMYQPQINPVFATVASSVILLNAFRLPKHEYPEQPELEVQRPKALGGGRVPFPAYSQLTFLNDKTDKIKDRKVIALKNATKENENDKGAFKPGIGLEELKKILAVYQLEVEVTLADQPADKGLAKFRSVLKTVLADDNRFLLANFNGVDLGAATEGTVSPLAAYDEKSDSVLILDVTGHKNPWYWVPVPALYGAMNTSYGEPKTWRGYAVVRDVKGEMF